MVAVATQCRINPTRAQPGRVLPFHAPLGRVAEWQTRTVQVRVSVRTWGFNSPLAHGWAGFTLLRRVGPSVMSAAGAEPPRAPRCGRFALGAASGSVATARRWLPVCRWTRPSCLPRGPSPRGPRGAVGSPWVRRSVPWRQPVVGSPFAGGPVGHVCPGGSLGRALLAESACRLARMSAPGAEPPGTPRCGRFLSGMASGSVATGRCWVPVCRWVRPSCLPRGPSPPGPEHPARLASEPVGAARWRSGPRSLPGRHARASRHPARLASIPPVAAPWGSRGSAPGQTCERARRAFFASRPRPSERALGPLDDQEWVAAGLVVGEGVQG